MEILFGDKSASDSSPCLIRVNSLSILCNAGISMSQLTRYPQQQTPTKFIYPNLTFCSPASVTLVLVSNVQDLFGIPYLVSKGFVGKAYVTQPVALLGKEILAKTAELAKRDLGAGVFYDPGQVEAALQQAVVTVSYREIVQVAPGVRIRAVSSGFELGSCNWNLWFGDTLVTYMSSSSMVPYRYPQEFDAEAVTGAEVLILRDGVMKETPAVPGLDFPLQTLWETINKCLGESSSAKVVIPINVLQLLDMLDMFTYKVNDRAEVILFSEICDALLGYPNSCCEFLCEKLKKKIMLGDEAFSFKKLIAQSTHIVITSCVEQFSHYKNVLHMQKMLGDKYRPLQELGSRVFLLTHSSLRLGESEIILRNLLEKSPDFTSVILVDPLFASSSAVLRPELAKLARPGRIYTNPLDARPGVEDIQALLGRCKAQHVVLPAGYKGYLDLAAEEQKSKRKHYLFEAEGIVKVELKDWLVGVSVDRQLYEEVAKASAGSGSQMLARAKFVGNDVVLVQAAAGKPDIKNLIADRMVRKALRGHCAAERGHCDLLDFVEYIKKNGVAAVKKEGAEGEYLIQTEKGEETGSVGVEGMGIAIRCDTAGFRARMTKLYQSYFL